VVDLVSKGQGVVEIIGNALVGAAADAPDEADPFPGDAVCRALDVGVFAGVSRLYGPSDQHLRVLLHGEEFGEQGIGGLGEG